ncbi:MAG: Coq4 family protein [Pseudomonadota bacterium]
MNTDSHRSPELSADPVDAGPQRRRAQPLVAWRALRRLLADPERTEEVFIVIRALAGDAIQRGLERFQRLPAGQRILTEKRELLDTLMDRDALAQHPAGSLAAAYLDFTGREQITADGLVDASDSEQEVYDNDWQRLYGERLRDQHDLWHTLTAYGRDVLGEMCLLWFTYAQTRNRGIGSIAAVALVKLIKEQGWSVAGAAWRAYRDGRRAEWLPGQDWEALLALPIETVRSNLRLVRPERYLAVRDSFEPLPA